jgi:hypothetical protein
MNLLLFIIGILTPIVFFIIGYKFANNKFKASSESQSVRDNEELIELCSHKFEQVNGVVHKCFKCGAIKVMEAKR